MDVSCLQQSWVSGVAPSPPVPHPLYGTSPSLLFTPTLDLISSASPAPSPLQGFPEWSSVMDGWGSALLGAATTVAGLLARGLGLGGSELQVRFRGRASAEVCEGV